MSDETYELIEGEIRSILTKSYKGNDEIKKICHQTLWVTRDEINGDNSFIYQSCFLHWLII